MSVSTLTALIARCRTLCRPRLPIADAELLRRFTQQRDAVAFEELLERYAPLVWGVCRRMLPSEADCEDAFQATFLALVRRPPTPPSPKLGEGGVGGQALGGWLHTVALRIIRKTQARARRQRTQATLPERGTAGDVGDEVGSRELFRMVDEEIERLPALLRLPLILCCLQGRTRDEAAGALGCSVAAVKSRLERGRNLLRRRLEKRGVQLPAAFLVLSLTTERIRAALWAKTMQSVLHTPSPVIARLAEAGVAAAAISKGKLFFAVLLLVSSAAGAAGMLLPKNSAEAPALPQKEQAAREPTRPEAPQIRRDRHGDPLPAGAIARLGTVRWRHGLFVGDLAYSPDGKMLAAAGIGRSVTLWDAATGQEVQQFPNRGHSLAVAFSPDGKILASADAPVCSLWDVATGKELRELKGLTKMVRGLVFAPDGKTLAAVGDDELACIWDAKDGRQLRWIDCKQGYLTAVAYSSDGKFLATAGKDGTICLWNPATGMADRQLHGHKKEVWKLIFSPDGKRLASSSADRTVRLWDVAMGRQIRIFGENLGTYNLPIAFSPDGTLLAAGADEGFIRLWDTADGSQKQRWQAGAMNLRAIAFSPDGRTLASGAAWEGIRLWDAATGRERHPSEEHLGLVNFVRFSPDGASLVSISRERRMVLWDLATQKPRRQFSWEGPGIGVSETALSPDGNTLAVGSWSDGPLRKVRLWDFRTGKIRSELGEPLPRFSSLAYSPDGRLVASKGSDRIIHIWDVRDGVEVRRISENISDVRNLLFSPDGKVLACGCDPNAKAANQAKVRLWDVGSGKECGRFYCSASGIYSLAFSSDGKVLATGDAFSPDRWLVRLWDTATGRELSSYAGHNGSIFAVALSPDGKLVASGTGKSWEGGDNSVHIWEAATGRLIRRFEGHHSNIGSVAFSPDGLTAASGAGDSTILLWDITGRRIDGRWHTKPLTPRRLDTCWEALANEDAAKAYDAVWALVAAPEQAIPFVRDHLTPVPRLDAKTVARLIADLDSDDFNIRQNATAELTKLGDAIAPALKQALASKPTLEMRRRIQQLLDQTREWTAERFCDHRAIQALEHIGTPSAREILRALAAGAPESRRTEEAKATLRRLAR